jgi:hypothetical protein
MIVSEVSPLARPNQFGTNPPTSGQMHLVFDAVEEDDSQFLAISVVSGQQAWRDV